MKEKHLEFRPKKTIYPKAVQLKLRKKAIEKVKSKFLPNNRVIKIVLIGSVVKGGFGEYEPPGFRGSLYSDFDFIVFVEDSYKIPKWLKREPSGKPFSERKLNLAYRNRKFVDRKYDVEMFFIREKDMNNKRVQKLGERAGIPMTKNSRHKYLAVYGGKR